MPSSAKTPPALGTQADAAASKKWTTTSYLLVLLSGCMCLSVGLTFYHGDATHQLHNDQAFELHPLEHHAAHKQSFLQESHKVSQQKKKRQKQAEEEDSSSGDANKNGKDDPAPQSSREEEEEAKGEQGHARDDTDHHELHPRERLHDGEPRQLPLATLNCEKYGGPLEREATQDLVYWQDIPSDTKYQSPFYQWNQQQVDSATGQRKPYYMTFEPDGGGWNNIRMAMETILGLAIATGRTLVLPPEQRMYLLRKDAKKHKTDFSFADFFPMHEIAAEQDGLHVITTEQFLQEQAMTGHLHNKYTGQREFPPGNRTNWDGEDVKPLKEWLRNVTTTPLWDPGHCMAAFPASTAASDVAALQGLHDEIKRKRDFQEESLIDNPPAVDASAYARLRDNLNHRPQLCLYNATYQHAPVLHFMCYHKMRVRFLTHFYSFLFFQDWREDLWMKRFMRDHVRYTDEIQCAAARVVQAMRAKALAATKGNSSEFDTFHIRRGDFQFKKTRIEATEIYDNVKEILPGHPQSNKKPVVFIATDERKKDFFDPLRTHYEVYFLDDFKHLLDGVNTNFFGMIDQLVASRGRLFFGCWHSTFTGFINRMRGYHSQNHRAAGYEVGALPHTYYYTPKNLQNAMHRYAPLKGAAFNRENPTAWRLLDVGIDDILLRMQEDKKASVQ